MNFDGPDWGGVGIFPLSHILGTIVTGFAALICLLVLVGLIFLLVRFLLVATRAAQVYLAKNAPADPAPTPTTATASAKPTTVAPPATTTKSTATKPARPPAPKG